MTVDDPVRTDQPLPLTDPERTASEELIIKEARRRHRRRRAAIVAIVLLVIAGVATAICISGHASSRIRSSATHTVRSEPTASGTRVCRSDQIRVTSLSGGAGAGNVNQWFGFANVGNRACTVTGYPRIVALDAEGEQVAVAEQRHTWFDGISTTVSPAPVVTLHPGQTASAVLGGTAIPVGSARTCPPGYPALLVTPPGGTQPVKVSAMDGWEPGSFPGCSAIWVTPVVPGTSGTVAAAVPPPSTRTAKPVEMAGPTTIP
jgi:hypothetical protein